MYLCATGTGKKVRVIVMAMFSEVKEWQQIEKSRMRCFVNRCSSKIEKICSNLVWKWRSELRKSEIPMKTRLGGHMRQSLLASSYTTTSIALRLITIWQMRLCAFVERKRRSINFIFWARLESSGARATTDAIMEIEESACVNMYRGRWFKIDGEGSLLPDPISRLIGNELVWTKWLLILVIIKIDRL